MAQNTPKRKIKDSVFTNLFQDKKYLLRLYKALHPEDSNVTEEDIKDVTIKHILVDADYNDLGFSVGGRLVILIESQSTWTLNYRNMLKEYLESKEQKVVDILLSEKRHLPQSLIESQILFPIISPKR